MKNLRIRLEPDPVMEAHRRSLKATKLVYFLIAQKPVRQTRGRSRILYIGTREKRVKRMASSAAYRAQEIFAMRGVRRLHVFAITRTGKKSLTARWKSMEQALWPSSAIGMVPFQPAMSEGDISSGAVALIGSAVEPRLIEFWSSLKA